MITTTARDDQTGDGERPRDQQRRGDDGDAGGDQRWRRRDDRGRTGGVSDDARRRRSAERAPARRATPASRGSRRSRATLRARAMLSPVCGLHVIVTSIGVVDGGSHHAVEPAGDLARRARATDRRPTPTSRGCSPRRGSASSRPGRGDGAVRVNVVAPHGDGRRSRRPSAARPLDSTTRSTSIPVVSPACGGDHVAAGAERRRPTRRTCPTVTAWPATSAAICVGPDRQGHRRAVDGQQVVTARRLRRRDERRLRPIAGLSSSVIATGRVVISP